MRLLQRLENKTCPITLHTTSIPNPVCCVLVYLIKANQLNCINMEASPTIVRRYGQDRTASKLRGPIAASLKNHQWQPLLKRPADIECRRWLMIRASWNVILKIGRGPDLLSTETKFSKLRFARQALKLLLQCTGFQRIILHPQTCRWVSPWHIHE